MDVREIREAMAEALAGASLRTLSYVPSKIDPPMAIVNVPDEVTYHTSFGKTVRALTIVVTLVLGSIDEQRAQEAIDAYSSIGTDQSVIDALEADRTLNGTVQDIQVVRAITYRADNNLIAIDFETEILA